MRFRTLVAEAWRSLAANASTTIAATMTVLIAMFILGLSIGLGTWALSWSNHVKQRARRQGLLLHAALVRQGRDARAGGARSANLLTPSSDARGQVGEVRLEGEALEDHARRSSPELTRAAAGQPAAGRVRDHAEARGGRRADRGQDPDRRRRRRREGDLRQEDREADPACARVIEIVFLLAVVVLLVASTC